MPPVEPSNRPSPGRSPYQRRPMSIDGMSYARPHARPTQPVRPQTPQASIPQNHAHLPPASTPQPLRPADDDALFQSLDTDNDKAFVPRPQIAAVEPQPEDLKPEPAPKKPRRKFPARKILKVLFVLVLAGAFGAGGYFALKYEKQRNDPTNVFNSAIKSALSTAQVETVTAVGSNSSDVSMDYTVPTNMSSSNKAVVTLAGATVHLTGYGSIKNTFIRYDELPDGVTNDVKAAKNAWVKLRSDGNLPAGINATLSNVSDPRYQSPGPIIFGNFNDKQSNFLRTYIVKHNLYNFDPKQVTHTVKDGQNVLAYSVKLDVSNIKYLNYSAASNEGLNNTGDEVTAGVDKLDSYKGTKVTIYILSGSHQFMGLDAVGKNLTISVRYSNFDNLNLPDEPQTKLSWSQFSITQQKIEAGAASKETPAQIDSQREAKLTSLHEYLAIFYSSNKHYPTFTDLNDQNWVKNNLSGLDPDAFHDPLSPNLKLSPMPTNSIFAYQPTADDGKSACDNLTQNCSHYVITAVLSNGKQYTVKDP